MAHEGVQSRIPAALAAADLSTKQFYFVKKNTTAFQFALASVDGEVVAGVLQDKPAAAGRAACVAFLGVTKIVAGENLAAGDYIGTDNAGKAKKVDVSATGADVGDFIAGYVLEGGSTGELVTIMLQPLYRVFAS